VLFCAVHAQTGEGLGEQLEKQGEAAHQQLKEQQGTAQAAEQSHAEVLQELEQQLSQAQQQLETCKAEVGACCAIWLLSCFLAGSLGPNHAAYISSVSNQIGTWQV
jgi:hypothetical protein